VAAAEKRPQGRPTKLTLELRDQLLAQLAVGAGLAEAATASGISARTLRSWRQRAWSARGAGPTLRQLERRLRDARASAPREPEAWRSTAEILLANERAWADLFVDGGI
jgi:transposase-like protein